MRANKPLKFYKEGLNEDELSFLKSKYQKDWKDFMNSYKIITLMCTVFSIVLLALFLFIYWLEPEQSTDYPEDNPLTLADILLTAGLGFLTILLLINISFGIRYQTYILPIKRDLQSEEKIIEQARIINKKFMPQNQTFHFYIDSPGKLSIEVDQTTFRSLQVGDEINLEYTERSKVNFGYF